MSFCSDLFSFESTEFYFEQVVGFNETIGFTDLVFSRFIVICCYFVDQCSILRLRLVNIQSLVGVSCTWHVVNKLEEIRLVKNNRSGSAHV